MNKKSRTSPLFKKSIIGTITLILLFFSLPSFAQMSITGEKNVCVGTSGWTGTYSLTGLTDNPRYFHWSVPSGATIVSGAGSPTIKVGSVSTSV